MNRVYLYFVNKHLYGWALLGLQGFNILFQTALFGTLSSECIWVQIKLMNNRNIFYGVLYRSPNADSSYLSLIEVSIALARDTDISDLIVTGDFKFNTCNYTHWRKIESICSQFDLTQCTDDLIVTGDIILNTCNYWRKIESICSQFDLTQCTDEPKHFSENSASTIDLLFVSNKSSILTNGRVNLG